MSVVLENFDTDTYVFPPVLSIGTICNLLDQVDPTMGNVCTVKFIEFDDEFNEIVYYYLRAANEELNTLFDERFGSYWCMVNNLSQYLIPLSPPVYE